METSSIDTDHSQFVMPTPGSLWDFASQVYASPAVEQHAISLQDENNANINIMLWCCWLEAQDIRLSANLLDEVLITIDAISSQTVGKLREARRELERTGGFTKVQALSIKKHILNAELAIEKVLLHRLQDMTCRFLESKEYREMCVNDPELTLEYYLHFINVPDAKEHATRFESECHKKDALEEH